MKYNDSLKYNEPSVSYIGSIQINIIGISDPIIVNSVAIYFAENPDYQNSTTLGIVTIDSISSSEMSITATQEQAFAIADATVIYVTPTASTSYEIINGQSVSTAEISIISSGSSSEVSLKNLGI